MFKKIKSTIAISIAFINVLFVIGMIVTGFGGYANPVTFNYIAVSTLAFPIFLLINILFSIFWMVFKFKFLLISLTGFIVCYQPIRTYCPFNIESEVPNDALKIISYNICAFREYDYREGEENPTITYLKDCKADIICLQEAIHGERINKLINKELDNIYPYSDFCIKGGGGVAILSKFPIISQEKVDYVSDSNLSRIWEINIDGDTVIVINNHLESNKLSDSDRSKFKKLIKENVNDKDVKEDTKWLIKKLAIAAEIRAPQADSIAKIIEKNKDKSIIVCGDFNDSPLSYVKRKISENLIDCYVKKGNGPGISYHTGGFYVRIDNTMCSSDWEVFKCEIDNKISVSDHYPICSWIKKRYKSVKKNNKTL